MAVQSLILILLVSLPFLGTATADVCSIRPLSAQQVDQLLEKVPEWENDGIQQAIDFKRAGGEGHFYFLNAGEVVDGRGYRPANGLYVLVSRFPKIAVPSSPATWLKDQYTLDQLQKLHSAFPIALTPMSMGIAGAVQDMSLRGDKPSLGSLLKDCGTLSSRHFFMISEALTPASLAHEVKHIQDVEVWDQMLVELEVLEKVYKGASTVVAAFVMEQRGYTEQIIFLRQLVKDNPSLMIWVHQEEDVGLRSRRVVIKQVSVADALKYDKNIAEEILHEAEANLKIVFDEAQRLSPPMAKLAREVVLKYIDRRIWDSRFGN